MTEKDHYKYGLSGDKVDVEVADLAASLSIRDQEVETLKAEYAELAADLASCNADRAQDQQRLFHIEGATLEFKELAETQAKSAEKGWNRVRALEAELARAKNVLTNIAESDPNWTTVINNFLQQATRRQTFQTPDQKDARIGKLEAALRKIGYEPIGHAEATDSEILIAIVGIARAALETHVPMPHDEADEVTRAALETPVSTLCAICDQIKELHPATHEWTARETK